MPLICFRMLSPLEREERGITATDNACMIEVNGEIIGWTDDYGTATMFKGYERLKDAAEKAIDSVVDLWATE